MGHHVVLMPRFDPGEFLRLVVEERINWLFTVPTIMHRLLPVYDADADAYDLSSIRRFWHVGAPCAPTVKERWIELLGPDALWELYGGTELQALAALSGGEWLAHRGSRPSDRRRDEARRRRQRKCPPGVSEIYAPAPGKGPTTATSARPPNLEGWDRWAIRLSTQTATSTSTTGESTCSLSRPKRLPDRGALCAIRCCLSAVYPTTIWVGSYRAGRRTR
jgi:bile acid-coenzyme A ligase